MVVFALHNNLSDPFAQLEVRFRLVHQIHQLLLDKQLALLVLDLIRELVGHFVYLLDDFVQRVLVAFQIERNRLDRLMALNVLYFLLESAVDLLLDPALLLAQLQLQFRVARRGPENVVHLHLRKIHLVGCGILV